MLDVTEQLERYGEAVERSIKESTGSRSPEPVPMPTEQARHVLRAPMLAAALAVILVVVLGVVAALRITHEPVSVNEPAGLPSGPPVAHLRIEALPSLSYQATEFTTIAGINEIELVDKGGTQTLVFDDPALSYFRLEAPAGPTVGKIRLEPGRDYRIGSSIAGHRAAGLEAVIHVLPARFGDVREPATLLPVPARGSARPEQLHDGTPVFVIRHEDDAVAVISAVSTHRPFGRQETVGWCGRARWFQDPYYGSSWDEYGRKVGGPAPTDLDQFESRLVENGKKVAVGGLVPSAGRTVGTDPEGEACAFSEGGDPEFSPGPLRLTPFRRTSAQSLDEAIQANSGKLVPVRDVTVLAAPGKPTRACATFDPSRLFRCRGPLVEGFEDVGVDACSSTGPAWRAVSGPALVRIDGDTIDEVVFVRRVRTEGPLDLCLQRAQP